MKLHHTKQTVASVPRQRWYVKIARGALGLAIVIKGVPMAHAYGWPWKAQAAIALIGGLVFSTDLVKLVAKSGAAVYRDVRAALAATGQPNA